MSDILTSVSLLLAVIGFLFSSWYPEIRKTLEIKIKTHIEDRTNQKKYIDEIYFGRSLPLTSALLVLTLIQIPETINIIFQSFDILDKYGLNAIKLYSTAKCSYCFVVLFALLFFIHSARLTYRVNKVRKEVQKS